MQVQTRVKLQVGGYNKKFHYCVIGSPTEFYLWCKDPGNRGRNSDWITGPLAHKHYHRMEELLQNSNDKLGFVSYARDLLESMNGATTAQ